MRNGVFVPLVFLFACRFDPIASLPNDTPSDAGVASSPPPTRTWRGPPDQRLGRSVPPRIISIRPDAGTRPPVGPPIPHLDLENSYAGTADLLVLTADLDTTDLSIRGTLVPPGVMFEAVAQSSEGPELAVLRVRSFELLPTGRVRVVGHRSLVIIAAGRVMIAGVLDVSAHREVPGPGGVDVLGEGESPTVAGTNADPGGGGGGFALEGAPGGAVAETPGGAGGSVYGDEMLSILTGGSAGGYGSPGRCDAASGGAGGGAVQIYAAVDIEVVWTGSIVAGGGGGRGGAICFGTDAGGGGGGGSGGAIDLMAPMITNYGNVAANGGAGGGAGSGGAASRRVARGAGDDGADAHSNAAARGGAPGGPYGTRGGFGGWQYGVPTAGDEHAGPGNAGGGGGSVGRIVFRTQDGPYVNRGTVTPQATSVPY